MRTTSAVIPDLRRAATVLLLLAATPAVAQEFPTKPIGMIADPARGPRNGT